MNGARISYANRDPAMCNMIGHVRIKKCCTLNPRFFIMHTPNWRAASWTTYICSFVVLYFICLSSVRCHAPYCAFLQLVDDNGDTWYFGRWLGCAVQIVECHRRTYDPFCLPDSCGPTVYLSVCRYCYVCKTVAKRLHPHAAILAGYESVVDKTNFWKNVDCWIF